MTAYGEILQGSESKPMPPPGTRPHLEFLKNLKIEDGHPWMDPRVFLTETMAPYTLAKSIRRNRTYWPIRNLQHADMDTRFLQWEGLQPFRGSVPLSANMGAHNLTIHGQSNDAYSYDLLIPLTRRYLYDPSGHIQASYGFANSEKRVYNEAADNEFYHEDDPRVLIDAVSSAASDLLDIFEIIQPVEAIEYGEVEVSWHPDYLTDDPNELLPRATRIQKVLQRIRQTNTPWRPGYLKDDPDEFLKVS